MPDLQTRWNPQERELSRVLHLAVDDAQPSESPPTVVRPMSAPVDLGRRRRWSLVAVPAVAACLVAAVVVGIGVATRGEPTPVASTPSGPLVEDARVLEGEWTGEVRVAGIAVRMRVSVRADQVSVSQGVCTTFLGMRTHSDGLLDLVGVPQTSQTDCDAANRHAAQALAQATTFHVAAADEVIFRSASDDLVTTLTRVGPPAALSDPIEIVAPLPAGLRPPTADDLQGRWFEAGAAEHWISFDQDRWSHSPDGCNTNTARFVLSPYGGALRSPATYMTQVGCGTSPDWPVVVAARFGLDGDQLVLLDASGAELARMNPARDAGDGSVLDRAQGRWESIGPMAPDGPLPGLWLEVEDDVLTHAGNASCNTDETGYTLSENGEVVDTLDAYALLSEGSVLCQPGFPDLVRGRVGRIALEGVQLVLINPGGSEIARFARADP